MKKTLLLVGCLFASSALAFRWEPNVVPTGDHSYTLEVRRTSDDMASGLATITMRSGC